MEQEHLTAFLKDRGIHLNPSFVSVLYKSFDGTPSDATGSKAASAFLDGLYQTTGIDVTDFHMQTVTVETTLHTYVTAVIDYTGAWNAACSKVNTHVNGFLQTLSMARLRQLKAIVYMPEKKCFGLVCESYNHMLGGTTKSTIPVDPNVHLEDSVLDIFRASLPKCLQPNG